MASLIANKSCKIWTIQVREDDSTDYVGLAIFVDGRNVSERNAEYI